MYIGRIQVAKLLEEANQIANAWAEKPSVVLGTVTLDEYRAVIAELEAIHSNVEQLFTQLKGQRNRRYDVADKMTKFITRARSGFRAAFGPDSAEYAQVGGTRLSLRESPSRNGTSDNSDDGSVVVNATGTSQ